MQGGDGREPICRLSHLILIANKATDITHFGLMRDSTTIDTDDDVFDRRYPQNYHYKRRTLSQFDSPSTSSLDSMLTGSDFLTNPNFVILFTICIIALYQFRGE